MNTINLNTNYLNSLSTKWQNLIANATWHVGGYSASASTAKTFYTNEITNNTSTYNAKIGLVYVSDYAYSVDPSFWTTNLNNYNTTTSNDWLFMGATEWTITRADTYTNLTFGLYDTGRIGGYNITYDATIRPVFYLNYNVELVSGDGTQNNPYRIA